MVHANEGEAIAVVTAVGVAIEHALTASPTNALPVAERWILCGALGACLAVLGVIYYTADAGTDRRFTLPSLVRLGSALLAYLVGALGAGLSPFAVMSLLGLASSSRLSSTFARGTSARARPPVVSEY